MAKSTRLKTLRLDVGVWYNPSTGHIHVAAKDQFISTVSNNPDSKRFHLNLYRKLTRALVEAGLPSPSADD